MGPAPVVDATPLLQLQAVSHAFAGRRVLDEVDLHVGAAEVVTLIGPNGAGKSTLVRIALGLLLPQTGEVRRRPGIAIGYVPQRLQVDPILPLTVRRFLTLGVAADTARLERRLDAVGARHVLDSPVQEISGGEMQRVLLARALLRDPALLVLDEPIQGVDVHGQHELFELIRSLRQEHGCGILLVSHDLHLVMAGSDRVVCLNGHVCCTGHPEEVSRNPAYLDLLGPMAASLALYTHHHDHRHDTPDTPCDHGERCQQEPHDG